MSVTKMPAAKKRKSSPRLQPKKEPAETAAIAAITSIAATTPTAVIAESPAMGVTVCLEPSLEIKDVEEAHRVLATTLTRGPRITVDVSRVVAIDTAGVQLLLAFQSEAAKRGVVTEYCGESAAIAHALTVLGLRDSLHIASPP